MIEWINNFFGIKNEISIPLVVSVIIFVTSGLTQLLFRTINNAISRKRTRKTFYALLIKTQKDIAIKEKKIFQFYPDFNIQFKGNWMLDYKLIGYLPNLLSLDFKDTYFSFRKRNIPLIGKFKKRDEAFHTIWQCLNNLSFIENRIEKELNTFQLSFNGFHQNYNYSIRELMNFIDDSNFEYNGLKRKEETVRVFDFLTERNEIWQKWLEIGEPDRIGYFSSFNHIVLPILELNKDYPELEMTKTSDRILVDCLHHYAEMENSLDLYHSKFRSFYFQYRIERRRIKICLLRLKKCAFPRSARFANNRTL